MSASTPETDQNPPKPEQVSYWQLGCDHARAGLPDQWTRLYAKEVADMHLDSWQRSLLRGGYLNGYNYGKQNKKAP